MQKVNLEPVTGSEAKHVVSHTQIQGIRDGQIIISPDELMHLPLQPKFKITIKGLPDITFWLTQAYRIKPGGGHYNITGFSGEDESSTTMRSFYLSGSQSVWRNVPFILHDDRGSDDSLHYGKGYSHRSTNVAAELQKSFAQITAQQHAVRSFKGAQDLFYGAVPWYNTDENVYDKLDENRVLPYHERHLMDCDYVRFTSPRPQWVDGNLYSGASDPGRIPPEKISVANWHSPFLGERIDQWTQQSPLYKTVSTDVFKSNDGNLIYLFNTDPDDVTWIGATHSSRGEITPTGNDRYWVNDGYLSTTRFEHPYFYSATDEKEDALNGYGSMRTRRWGYADMHPRYLSRMKAIQQYRESTGKN